MTALISRAQPKPPFATMAQWEAYKSVIDFLDAAYNSGAWLGERDDDGALFALDVKQVQSLAEQWARTLTQPPING